MEGEAAGSAKIRELFTPLHHRACALPLKNAHQHLSIFPSILKGGMGGG